MTNAVIVSPSRWFAAEAVRNYGDVVPSSIPGVQNIVIKQPVGVCGISEHLICMNCPLRAYTDYVIALLQLLRGT